MSSRTVSIIVGDHPALPAVRAELSELGDDVMHLGPDGGSGFDRPLDSVLTDDLAAASLTVGLLPGPGAARRSLDVVRTVVGHRAPGGLRVALVSGRDYLGWPRRADDALELAGIVAAGRSLALELGVHGVTVNVVCPPAELGATVPGDDPWAAPPSPPTGVVDVDDIAYAVGFLTRPDTGYVTGQVLHVSGGLSVLSSLSS